MYKLSDPQRPLQMAIAMMYLAVVGLLVLLVAVHHVTKIPFANFTADPATVFGYNPLFGYVSNLGIILWVGGASVCLFAALLLNVRKDQAKHVAFLLNFGALTAVLMLDDLFMFHEKLAPEYLSISEKWILISYALYAAGCLYHFRDVIMGHDKKFLLISFSAFAASVLLDQIATRYYFPGEFLFEDGLKFIGIASWLAYFLNFSFYKILFIIANTTMSRNRDKINKEFRKNYWISPN